MDAAKTTKGNVDTQVDDAPRADNGRGDVSEPEPLTLEEAFLVLDTLKPYWNAFKQETDLAVMATMLDEMGQRAPGDTFKLLSALTRKSEDTLTVELENEFDVLNALRTALADQNVGELVAVANALGLIDA